MSLFFVDSAGDRSLLEKDSLGPNDASDYKVILSGERPKAKVPEAILDDEDSEDDTAESDFFGLPPPTVDLTKIINNALSKGSHKQSKVEQDLEYAKDRIDSVAEKAKKHRPMSRGRVKKLDESDFDKSTGKLACELEFITNVDDQLAKSELKPGFEKLQTIPSHKAMYLRKLKKIEKSKTKGPEWFDMPATELTEEVANDLKILQMRSVLDPKHFYKKNDLKVLPKYFQIGTVQHSPLDYYKEKDTRKNKKHSMLEEVMKDEAVINYSKRKYQEITARRDKYAHRKAMKKMRKLKKNK